jgi:tetratricopeptide (TPR) repeat protein
VDVDKVATVFNLASHPQTSHRVNSGAFPFIVTALATVVCLSLTPVLAQSGLAQSGLAQSSLAQSSLAQSSLAKPTPRPSTEVAKPEIALGPDALEAKRSGVILWRIAPAPPSVLTVPRGVLVAEGSSVTLRAADTGQVLERSFLSGKVMLLEPSGVDVRASVQLDSGIREGFTLRGTKAMERVTFPPSKSLLATLEPAANLNLTQLRAMVNLDPSNSLLLANFAAALERDKQPASALEQFRKALAKSEPFFVSIRLAALLERFNQPDLADDGLRRARVQYAKSGYDPAFRVNQSALAAWGDPLGTARSLFKSGNAKRGGVWLEFLRNTMPRFAGFDAAYVEYATWLQTQGNPGEAEQWLEFNRLLAQGTSFRLGEQAPSRIAGLSLAAALALLFAYVALQLVLAAKYWGVQSKDLKPFGGRFGAWRSAPFQRLRFAMPAYQTFTERFVLLTILASVLALMVVHNWSTRSRAALAEPALSQGTLGGANFWAKYADQPSTTGGEALRGLAAQLDGDLERAAKFAKNAPASAMAVNNLGVIASVRNDTATATAQYREALKLDQNALAPAYNLGNAPNGYRVTFHNLTRAGQAMLAVPEPKELVNTVAGDLGGEFSSLARDPWQYLSTLALPGFLQLPGWALQLIGVILLVLTIGNVLWLVLPRPVSTRLAPRGLLYELLAILIPGTGLADEVWGLFLLAPWAAIIGALALFRSGYALLAPALFASSSPLGLARAPAWIELDNLELWLLGVLVLIYVINLMAWLLEFIGYRRKLRAAGQASA